MIDSELHNFFKVAESRNINTEEVAEMLMINGRQIYLHFTKEHMGTLLYDGFKNVEKDINYKIESGKVYPLTPDSRNDLVNALREGKDNFESKIRVDWEDSENNHYGYFIIKVEVNLKSNLVLDYEDFKFLPPPTDIKRGPSVSDGSSPPKFFADNYFHQLVLRTMRAEGYNWNTVKRNLKKHTLDGENIKIIKVSNHEGEMRPQIQFDAEGFIEPYKIMESTFKKSLIAYRNHLNKLPLPGNK